MSDKLQIGIKQCPGIKTLSKPIDQNSNRTIPDENAE